MCNQREKTSLDHLYSTHRDAYKALPRPPFGKCLQAKMKAGSTSVCFASTDNMFRDSSDGIEEYTTSVTGFINQCIEDVVPKVTVRSYPNQKPGITCNIRNELKGRAAAFKERDSNPEAYKKSRYAQRRTIKQAKRQYMAKIESNIHAIHHPNCMIAHDYCKWLNEHFLFF